MNKKKKERPALDKFVTIKMILFSFVALAIFGYGASLVNLSLSMYIYLAVFVVSFIVSFFVWMVFVYEGK